jgi:hypothetical protein
MARLQAHAWQLLALLLAVLLVWQSLARLGAERDAAQARSDLALDREAAATAALRESERYRQREGAYREHLDALARDADLALARAAADADAARAAAGRLRGDLASYITAHRAAAQARATAGQCAPDTAALDLLASCSAALTSERERWRALLTTPATEAAPASAPTTPGSP